ncbi:MULTISPECIES: DNA cytosine methyltransferase [unclassified Okeania]|uniref:DNA cytosine methyltransferase n=1 Tax=unclassified Okeania TaxID=2634635 RepID=UPI0013B933A2|nr:MULTISPECIES: DNA (cytosine-5-)-methyltransferase [unclassified Okeania]NES77416.1 DNA cytosine methyltransferase [Okeania sp. SIO1H4]NET16163.1 DNA cytosine methyltransferase [Okeania sp. SIO1H6]NET20921.1 DNA cytosine methyltransferase [Okeania sp. SIO1H5]NET95883.1 DNA cytosine methyltransferase [Okeania sp. SIO1H2]
MSTLSSHHGWNITEAQREIYRQRSKASSRAKKQALNGEGQKPIHPINIPNLNPEKLMPQMPRNKWRTLSLFSGGGGLNLGFDRAGFTHIASYDILKEAGNTLRNLRPDWQVFSGEKGDVTKIDWRSYCGTVDIIHGGPPCQPFSVAGRQKGQEDNRDMFPEFIRAVLEIKPLIFVAENVTALISKKFSKYVEEVIEFPLVPHYKLTKFILNAPDFGIPQIRKRVFLVGFRDEKCLGKYQLPQPTHYWHHLPKNKSKKPIQLNIFDNLEAPEKLQCCMGTREALGLPNIGFDALSPTLRSGLTGPRHTTSILSSVSAQKAWEKLQIWPNGVAKNRENAHLFVAKNNHFRLSVPDCGILQGFPESWQFSGAVYQALGQIGNAVPPPMAYQIAVSISQVFS